MLGLHIATSEHDSNNTRGGTLEQNASIFTTWLTRNGYSFQNDAAPRREKILRHLKQTY